MATLWLTYAWVDNAHRDVDFVAQELVQAGVNVTLDRWTIQAGKPLWEQIASFIQDAEHSDAWAIYATQNSLGSKPCKEEFAYALDRALHTRGEAFPVIGLFPGSVDWGLVPLVPAGIRTRLCVSLTDPDWKERVQASVEGRALSISHPPIHPYHLSVDPDSSPGSSRWVIEVRPRAGTWAPFMAAIPAAEKDSVNPGLFYGHRDGAPMLTTMIGVREGMSDDGQWWVMVADNEASPTQSYYIDCVEIPSVLIFGVNDGRPQYRVNARHNYLYADGE